MSKELCNMSGKVCFDTKQDATLSAALDGARGKYKAGTKLYAYKCECGFFHLTRKSQ